MGAGNELVYAGFIICEKRVDMFFVENAGALGLRENEVEEEEQAKIAVEWDPMTAKAV